MESVLVRSIYTVDTISKGNYKAWVKLMDYMKDKQPDEQVEFDFKGIEVIQPWATSEFKVFMQDERVHLKLWCSEQTVNSINIMCMLNGVSDNRAVNVEVVPEKKLSKEEQQIMRMAEELQTYFDIDDDGDVVLNIHKRFDQIGVPITVKYIEAAMKKYAEEHRINRIRLEAKGIVIQPSVIETVTNLIEQMAKVGVELEINSNDEEVMNKVGMYRSLSNNKVISDEDKLRIVKANLYPGKVGMLIRYKDSKAVDEFGRSGKGKPVNCRVAIYIGLKMTDKGNCVVFNTYNGNTFYTRVHWALEHDNEVLKELEYDTVTIPLSQFGMYNDFLGSKYHLITPVQVRENDSVTIYDINEDNRVVHSRVTIPERIRVVFDEWGVEYDKEGVQNYIKKTRELLG